MITMDNQQERLVIQAQLAMLIDCEGSISMRLAQPDKHRRQGRVVPQITVSNTSELLLTWLQEVQSKFGFPMYIQWVKAHDLGKLPQWRMTIKGIERVSKFLPLIKDSLIIKKDKAVLVEEFIKLRKAAKKTDPYSNRELEIAIKVRKNPSKGISWQPKSSETTRQIEEFRETVKAARSSNDIVRPSFESKRNALEIDASLA